MSELGTLAVERRGRAEFRAFHADWRSTVRSNPQADAPGRSGTLRTDAASKGGPQEVDRLRVADCLRDANPTYRTYGREFDGENDGARLRSGWSEPLPYPAGVKHLPNRGQLRRNGARRAGVRLPLVREEGLNSRARAGSPRTPRQQQRKHGESSNERVPGCRGHVRGLNLEVPPPDGSRLSCGRLARGRHVSLNDTSCALAHSAPLPLKRSAPDSVHFVPGSGG